MFLVQGKLKRDLSHAFGSSDIEIGREIKKKNSPSERVSKQLNVVEFSRFFSNTSGKIP